MSTISRLFFDQCNRTPDKVAVIIGERKVTYSELLLYTQQQAHILRLNDVRRCDHIMSQLDYGLDFIILMLACADIGVALVPMNPHSPKEVIENVALATDTKIVISEGFESIKTTFNTRLKFTGKPEDLFLLITTSGSTGEPKPIMLTQSTKIARVISLIELYDITGNDVILVCTPLYHSMAQRLILTSVLLGCTLVIQPKWFASEWQRLVKEHQVTFSIPVASQVKQLVAHIPVTDNGLESMRCLVSSSATLEAGMLEKMRARLNCAVHNCYGTSEIAIATNRTSDDIMFVSKSVGRSIPGVDIKISDEGEILIKTPCIFDGYYGKGSFTEDSIIDGYFKTGDLGSRSLVDLTYLGRIKELINVGGTKVYPEDVERVISQYSYILECAAFSQYDENFGEIVAIAIVSDLKFSLNELQMFCLEHLTNEQLPRALYQVESLPKTESGKLQRCKLTEMYGAKNE